MLRTMFDLRASSLAAAAVVLACGGGDSGQGGGTGGGGAGGGGAVEGGAGSVATGGSAGSGGSAVTGGSGRLTCVVTETSGGTTIYMVCEEGTGLYADQIRAACSRPPADAAVAPHAEITSDPCPHANALGACTITTGAGSFTGWHYADGTTTSEQIAMLCAQTGQMFIPP